MHLLSNQISFFQLYYEHKCIYISQLLFRMDFHLDKILSTLFMKFRLCGAISNDLYSQLFKLAKIRQEPWALKPKVDVLPVIFPNFAKFVSA